MESDERDRARRQLHDIERGQAAPWIRYPKQPMWLPAAFGAFAAVFTLVIGLLDGAARGSAVLALVVVELAYIAWERRRRGALPTGRAPRELHRSMAICGLGLLAIVLAVWAVGTGIGVWPAAALAGVTTWLLMTWYGRAYEAAAERLRARLA